MRVFVGPSVAVFIIRPETAAPDLDAGSGAITSAPRWKLLRRTFNQSSNLIAVSRLISPGVIKLRWISSGRKKKKKRINEVLTDWRLFGHEHLKAAGGERTRF